MMKFAFLSYRRVLPVGSSFGCDISDHSYGKLFYGMVTLVQYILFGSACNLNAADGLVGTPALILQGNADQEVTPDGCSLYAHRNELPAFPPCSG